jgi:hypothetical protein
MQCCVGSAPSPSPPSPSPPTPTSTNLGVDVSSRPIRVQPFILFEVAMSSSQTSGYFPN